MGNGQRLELELRTEYHQFYIRDLEIETLPEWDDDTGLLGVRPAIAQLTTATQSGTIRVVCVVADTDLDPSVDYDDIVEASFRLPSGNLQIVEWGDQDHYAISPLATGPGTYRIRYHARNMDQAASTLDESDEYLIQLWPSTEMPARTVKVTTAQAKYWLGL